MRKPSARGYALVILSLFGPFSVSGAEEDGPRWKLSYIRQYGFYLTSGVAGQAELFATNEDGSYADIGMTNESNSHFAIFEPADAGGVAEMRRFLDACTWGCATMIWSPGATRLHVQIGISRYRVSTDRKPTQTGTSA